MEEGKVYEMQYLTDNEQLVINAMRFRKDNEVINTTNHTDGVINIGVVMVDQKERVYEWLHFFGIKEHSQKTFDKSINFKAELNETVTLMIFLTA